MDYFEKEESRATQQPVPAPVTPSAFRPQNAPVTPPNGRKRDITVWKGSLMIEFFQIEILLQCTNF
jgi:hypothetical protein